MAWVPLRTGFDYGALFDPMQPGFSTVSLRAKASLLSLLVVFALWLAYAVVTQFVVPRFYDDRPVFAFERIIAAHTLAALNEERLPETLQVLFEDSDGDWIGEIDRYCELAVEDGVFPVEAYPDWALAHFLIGDEQRAHALIAEVLELQRAAGSGWTVEAVLVKDYLGGFPLTEEKQGRAVSGWEDGTAGWPVYHILSKQGDDNGLQLLSWLDEVGGRIVIRGTAASLALYVTCGVGLLCALFCVLRRRSIPQAPRAFRLPSRWDLPAVLRLFFLSMIVSALAYYVIAYGLAFFGDYVGGTVLGAVVFAALPAVWMTFTLTPGFGEAGRLFGLGGRTANFPLRWSVLLALAVAGVSLLLGQLLYEGLQWDITYRNPQDWLRFDMLDTHLNKRLGLALAVVAAPICEELVFRGFLFGAMRTRMSPGLAAVLSSVIFATIHWYGVLGWLQVFAIGLAFCWLFHRSNSLLSGMIAHAVYNLVLVLYVQGWYSF